MSKDIYAFRGPEKIHTVKGGLFHPQLCLQSGQKTTYSPNLMYQKQKASSTSVKHVLDEHLFLEEVNQWLGNIDNEEDPAT
jgi:hypothetical protein